MNSILQIPDHTFKLVLIGDHDVGKSHIVSRYVYNVFNDEKLTTTTIGT
jgi:GTPase SAR1 family protein